VSEGGKRLRIGTRGSLLARTQTGMVVERLQAANPEVVIETQIIQTTGDVQRNVPFAQVGTKGMFVKEIEQALLDGVIDVVHEDAAATVIERGARDLGPLHVLELAIDGG